MQPAVRARVPRHSRTYVRAHAHASRMTVPSLPRLLFVLLACSQLVLPVDGKKSKKKKKKVRSHVRSTAGTPPRYRGCGWL